jgi:hypothetical protein
MKRDLVLFLVLIVVFINVLARDCTKAIITMRQALKKEYSGAVLRAHGEWAKKRKFIDG